MFYRFEDFDSQVHWTCKLVLQDNKTNQISYQQ